MEITSVKKYKGTTYEVEIDNSRKIYLHIDIITDFAVCTGMELEREELKKIIYASNFRRAYQYALYCLDYRDYSAEEIYQKILKTYKNEQLCLNVVKKLASMGLIDDKRYAERLARKLVESKKYGLKRARREIILKGIDQFTADDALESYEDTVKENLSYLVKTKYAYLLCDKDDRKSTEKVKSILVRYGYSFDEINRAVKDYFENTESEEM